MSQHHGCVLPSACPDCATDNPRPDRCAGQRMRRDGSWQRCTAQPAPELGDLCRNCDRRLEQLQAELAARPSHTRGQLGTTPPEADPMAGHRLPEDPHPDWPDTEELLP